MRYEEEYRNLIRLLESSHLDNMKVIRAIISPDDTSVLVIGNKTEKVICFLSHSLDFSGFTFLI